MKGRVWRGKLQERRRQHCTSHSCGFLCSEVVSSSRHLPLPTHQHKFLNINQSLDNGWLAGLSISRNIQIDLKHPNAMIVASLHTPCLTLSTLHFTLNASHFTALIPHSTLHIPTLHSTSHSAPPTAQSMLHTLHTPDSSLHIHTSHFTVFTSHSTLHDTLHSICPNFAFGSAYCTFRTAHFTLSTPDSALHASQVRLFTPHHTPHSQSP